MLGLELATAARKRNSTLYSVFQPLLQLNTGELAGYEALIRSTTNDTPECLFQFARSAGFLYELDVMSMKRSVSAYFAEMFDKNNSPLLFVNIFPSTLLNPSFSMFVCNEKSDST
ncbi:EAL domain-containing protein [Cohnella abietis]|uniref:EAL domain-containing protein n=1 Tax=Cohnella abietis TaxID=2507935 RepID=UPI00102E4D4D|nr:EAL domain-containing protein [Cohnella abietis]